MTTESDGPRVGDYVTDSTDDDPDEAVVLHRPDATASEWVIEDTDQTVAEHNSDHPADSPVAVVAFERALNAALPDWQFTDADNLWRRAQECDLQYYAYPITRLNVHEHALKDIIHLWFDGACEPMNPGGHATFGVVATTDDGEVIHEEVGHVGEGSGMTNNIAEYHGAIAALEYAADVHPDDRVVLHSDSELVINQLAGECVVRSQNLIPLHREARKLAADLDVKYRWVSREQNERADALTKRAYEEAANSEAVEERRQRAREEDMVIQPLGGAEYRVKDEYVVDLDARTCTCPDHQNRSIACKHIHAVELETVEQEA